MDNTLSVVNTQESKHHWIVLCALLFLGITLYSNVLTYPFVHDDIVFIKNNPQIKDLGNIQSAFQQPQWTSALRLNAYWRPFLEIVYRLEYAVFGTNPAGYHLVNILLHVLNSLCLYLLFTRLGQTPLFSLLTALIFLVHPVQTEAVTCIVGISNLLFAFFALTSFIAYLKPRLSMRPLARVFWQLMSVLAYFLSLLTKEQAIIIIGVLILYEICLNTEKERLFKKIMRVFPHAITAVGYLMLRHMVLGKASFAFSLYQRGLWSRLQTIPDVLLMQWRLLIWPSDLHYFRSWDFLKTAGHAVLWLAVLVLALIFLARRLDVPQKRLALFTSGWFFVFLLPTMNIAPLIIEYSKLFVFEHFLYLPLVGFFVLLLIYLEAYLKIFSDAEANRKFAAVFAVVFLAGMFLTRQQNTYWRAEVPLFERAVRYEQDIGRLRILLGKAYYFEKKFDAASQQYQKAVAILQGYLPKIQDDGAYRFYLGVIKGAYFDLAHVREDQGDLPAAADVYEKAIAIDGHDAVLYNNLATVFMRLGDTVKVGESLEKAAALDPQNLEVMNNLAIVYIQQNKTQEARKMFERVLALDPNFEPARRNLEQLVGPSDRP